MNKVLFYLTFSILIIISSCKKNEIIDVDEFDTLPKINNLNSEGLTNPNATFKTKNLYSFLQDISNRSFIYGQQDATISGVNWLYDNDRSDIKDVIGDHPGIMGIDIGGIEFGHKNSWFSHSFDLLRKRAIEFYEKGGIITISWHSFNFLTTNDSWDTSTPNINAMLLMRNSYENDKFIKGLDLLSNYLMSFKDSEGNFIPILFRPFHEHNQSGFWWSVNLNSTEYYIKLWEYTYLYLLSKGNNHLIFVYSPQIDIRPDDINYYLLGYPGDKYVDVLAVDCYHGSNINTLKKVNKTVSEIALNKKKIWGISEIGTLNNTDSRYWTEYILAGTLNYHPSYILTWRNKTNTFYFGVHNNSNMKPDFIKFYNSNRTIFQKELYSLLRN